MTPKVKAGAAALVLLAIFATAFAFMNFNRVQIWPLRGLYPVTVVIAVSFVLGATCGALGTFLLSYARSRRSTSMIDIVQPGQRETPGRP